MADWSVENMNPNITPSGMLLDASMLPKKEKDATKHLILIRLK